MWLKGRCTLSYRLSQVIWMWGSLHVTARWHSIGGTGIDTCEVGRSFPSQCPSVCRYLPSQSWTEKPTREGLLTWHDCFWPMLPTLPRNKYDLLEQSTSTNFHLSSAYEVTIHGPSPARTCVSHHHHSKRSQFRFHADALPPRPAKC